MSRMPKYEIFQGGPEHWFWRLKAGNGEIICHSETFPSKGNAKRACKRARQLSRFALIKDATGKS